ncbi:protein Skeletor, isoforms B/C-like [Diadema setosum]|uniref:protein Skeletor, isoforms B/C-like n=1 Tax=Diadema setosum TaxID=31175 RepID=UPI003B3BC917
MHDGRQTMNDHNSSLESYTQEFPNCETLIEGEVQVSWKINGSDIIFQLRSKTTVQEKYLAFGVSGSQTENLMDGGDVTVTYINSTGHAQAIDYYLGSYSQCTPQTGQGACPDTLASNQANDNVGLIDFFVEDGITSITYRRPLAAHDTIFDKDILLAQPTYMIWARGPINAAGTVAIHSARVNRNSNFRINFGRVVSSCPPLVATVDTVTTPTPIPQWRIPRIIARQNTTFTAEMGPSGGEQGYEAITGRIGWGIAWYINDYLIPELVVERGRTYTFLVHGGNDSTFSANYHPFYITDSEDGGYEQLSPEVQQVTLQGPLCQWQEPTGGVDTLTVSTFEEYLAMLNKMCEPGEPAELVWTVADDTPDVVFYQCYTHLFLGWKILVLDPDQPTPTEQPDVPEPITSPTPDTTTSDASNFSASMILLVLIVAVLRILA